jgi:hypothetical protein
MPRWCCLPSGAWTSGHPYPAGRQARCQRAQQPGPRLLLRAQQRRPVGPAQGAAQGGRSGEAGQLTLEADPQAVVDLLELVARGLADAAPRLQVFGAPRLQLCDRLAGARLESLVLVKPGLGSAVQDLGAQKGGTKFWGPH